MRIQIQIAFLVAGCLTLVACGESSNQTTPANTYSATIRRTAYGVPHILASDFGSLGYGQGYAQAQDYACTVADQIVKVRSERARFFGRGDNDSNLNSDLAYLALDVYGRAERAFASQPDDLKEFLTGYAAGFNAYLAATPANKLPGWCSGSTAPAWVRPITAVDLAAYVDSVLLLASSGQLLDFIASAQPPDGSSANGAAVPAARFNASGRAAFRPDPGSNGWAIGAERSEGGRGMLVANPHFPWEGELRFWENQLTIPGKLNVYGASLIGLPTILIGFNEHVAWTQTWSAGTRFTVYGLDLVPGDPTSYLYDGAPRAMTARPFTVKVREADGSETEVTRSLYFSHYGPILDIPGFGWSAQSALTYRDANIDNDKGLLQYLRMNQAASLAEFEGAHAEVQGISLANTMAASADGVAWYIDASATPNLSADALAAWSQAVQSDPIVGAAYNNYGFVLLDGSHSMFEWVDVPGARSPGLIPFSGMPQVERADYVFNSNDSHWVANPAALLEGFSPLQGLERTPLYPRTRRNALTLGDRSADGPSGADGRFSLAELQTAILGNYGLIAELLRAPVVERCRNAAGPVAVGDAQVELGGACDVLAHWDGRSDLDSAGAPLWREFVTSFSWPDLLGAPDGILFAQPFDPADPIGTPSGLAAAPAQGSDPILEHLGMAVHHLQAGGFALAATLGEMQFSARDPHHTPVHGGTNPEGMENVAEVGTGGVESSLEPEPAIGASIDGSYALTPDGYPIDFGSSFVLAMEYTDSGPHAVSVTTYSESDDPNSVHFADQAELFSRKQWKPVAFTEQEIAADPALKTMTVSGSREPNS